MVLIMIKQPYQAVLINGVNDEKIAMSVFSNKLC
jgi:hypothetical protein